MNNTKSYIASQQKESKNFNIKAEFDSNLNLSDLILIRYFFQQQTYHSKFFYSQRYLALVTKLSYSTVKRSLNRLKALGYITSIKRHYTSCVYNLAEIFSDIYVKEQIKKYFNISLLIALLFSFPGSYRAGERVLITKDIKLYNCDVTNVTKNVTKQTNKPLLFEQPPNIWMYTDCDGGEPNKKVTFKEFEALFEERKPVEFSSEELLQLSQFSKETIDYARNIYNLDTQRGKQISNPFKYFYGICERRHLTSPKMGKSEASHKSTVHPSSVEYVKPSRAQEQYEFLMRIYERQMKLRQRGWDWRGLSFNEMYYTLIGYMDPKLLLGDMPPPEKPIYTDNVVMQKDFSMTQLVKMMTQEEESPDFPVLGIKQTQLPPESQDSIEQIDYESFEEILD